MKKALCVTISAVMIFWLSLLGISCTRNNPLPEVDVLTPQKAVPVAQLTGIAAGRGASVSFCKAGMISALSVKIGDTVSKGDTLAMLDNRAEVNELATCKSELAVERLHLQQLTTTDRIIAEQKVILARSELEVSRKLLERKRASLVQGTIPQSEFDEIAAHHARSESANSIAEAELTSLTAVQSALVQQKIRQAELKLEAAEIQLEQTILKAPYSGIVSFVNVHPGSFCEKGTDIIRLVKHDGSKLIMADFSLNHTFFMFREGLKVTIRYESGIIHGTLLQFFRYASNAGDSLIELHLLPTDTSRQKVTHGTPLKVDIAGDTLTDALVTSPLFINNCGSRRCVNIKRGNSIQSTEVTCGSVSDGRMIIYKGVNPGDTLLALQVPAGN